MDRTQMIAALIAVTTCALEESALELLTDVQLKALVDIEPPGADPPVADHAAADPGEARIVALEEQIAGLVAATADSTADREAERQALVAELAANERCVFSQQELETQPIETLRKLAQSIMGVNYSAQGGPSVDAQDDRLGGFMPTKSYWQNDAGGEGGNGGDG